MVNASARVLAFVSSSVPYGQRLASSGPNGESLKLWEERETQNWPRLSPDGRRLVRQRLHAVTGTPELWVEDLERGTRHRLTKEGAAGLMPVWSPDGYRVAYLTGTRATPAIAIAAADGTGDLSPVACPGKLCTPNDWSRDGRGLLTTVYSSAGVDVWILPTDGRDGSRPLLAEPFVERDARLSPDGRLVAYVSEEAGPPEVSVQALGGETPSREVISVSGGDQPVWSGNGTNLFFVDPQGLLRSVSVRRGPQGRPEFGRSVRLDLPEIGFGHYGTQYDVSPDGRRIYFFDRRVEPSAVEIGIVLGWRALLK